MERGGGGELTAEEFAGAPQPRDRDLGAFFLLAAATSAARARVAGFVRSPRRAGGSPCGAGESGACRRMQVEDARAVIAEGVDVIGSSRRSDRLRLKGTREVGGRVERDLQQEGPRGGRGGADARRTLGPGEEGCARAMAGRRPEDRRGRRSRSWRAQVLRTSSWRSHASSISLIAKTAFACPLRRRTRGRSPLAAPSSFAADPTQIIERAFSGTSCTWPMGAGRDVTERHVPGRSFIWTGERGSGVTIHNPQGVSGTADTGVGDQGVENSPGVSNVKVGEEIPRGAKMRLIGQGPATTSSFTMTSSHHPASASDGFTKTPH